MRRPARTLALALALILPAGACAPGASERPLVQIASDAAAGPASDASLDESLDAPKPEAVRAATIETKPGKAEQPRESAARDPAPPPLAPPMTTSALGLTAAPQPDQRFGRAEEARKRSPAHRQMDLDQQLNRHLAVEKERNSVPDDRSQDFEEGGEFVGKTTNPLVDPAVDALSTFAIDVDTGSYTLSRRFLENGAMPQAQGVRVEEWVNAFHYSYPDESAEHPFSIHVEGAPLAKRSYVMRIGIQGRRVDKAERAPVHLTFLADVSGSMSGADRLPLAKKALGLLVGELGPKDSVSLVTYAGDTRVVLAATAVTPANRARILAAIDDLRNGGGTAMGSGMELAYREATKALGDKGVSRVIVLSDGDANIGRTSHQQMLQSIKGYVSEGVTMSTVGFGTGNYRDNLMEQLADAGNGNYSYVGSLKDARKIFVDDLTGTLQVIAKDTKIQVEMNKDIVESYRLIGYENRDIADHDFRNDKVDAGEIGAGHTVTALYEVNLKSDDASADIATVRVRYQQPRGGQATEVSARFPATAMKHSVDAMSADGRYATGVALTAEVFRHSEHMARLGIGLDDAHALLMSGAVGPFAAERLELARLIAPLVAGAPVATR